MSIANRNLGIIFRTFTYLGQEIFLIPNKSMVRPHLGYASVIWSPLYTKDKITLENTQCTATCLVSSLKVLSYPERLRRLGLPTMKELMSWKYYTDLVNKAKLLQMATYQSTCGNPFKPFKRCARLKACANSFSLIRVIDNWNTLPTF